MATQIIMLKVKEDCRQILYHYYLIFMKISIPLKYWVTKLRYNILWSDLIFCNICNRVTHVLLRNNRHWMI